MSGVGSVAFDYSLWVSTYPELSQIDGTTAAGYFTQAQLYLNNTATSPVRDSSPGGARALLLNMLTAHLAKLYYPFDGRDSPQVVGRLSNATEGSVTAAFSMDSQPGTAAWYNQTKYGAAYWAAMAPYRTMQYNPGPVPYLGIGAGPVPGGRGWGWGPGFWGRGGWVG